MLPLTSPQRHAPSGVDPAALLAGWLAETRGGDDLKPRVLRLPDGRVMPLPVARWAGPADAADEALLTRATGPVLDVGCGPGRLTAALHAKGSDVLGLELVEQIPVLVRGAGAPLLLGDIFGPVPRAGQWRTLLLADGNIGIGGDPVRLLRRCRDLLTADGKVLCELHPGEQAPVGRVRMEGLGTTSAWFPWALLSTDRLSATAGAAGFDVIETWSMQGRDFATLVPT